MPRTTIDIDVAVLRELKRRQRREGKTLGRLVTELLARALGIKVGSEPIPLRWTVRNMRARVEVGDKEAVRHVLGEPIPPVPPDPIGAAMGSLVGGGPNSEALRSILREEESAVEKRKHGDRDRPRE